jgi:hypothetical protein
VAAIHLGRTSPSASCNLPGRLGRKSPEGRPSRRHYSVLLPVGFAMPLPLPEARWALTPPFHPYPAHGSALPEPIQRRGGFLSVALSLRSPSPELIRHRISVEPGLSSRAAFRRLRVRPPSRLALRIKGFRGQNATPSTPLGALTGMLSKLSLQCGASPSRSMRWKRDSCAWRRARHCT